MNEKVLKHWKGQFGTPSWRFNPGLATPSGAKVNIFKSAQRLQRGKKEQEVIYTRGLVTNRRDFSSSRQLILLNGFLKDVNRKRKRTSFKGRFRQLPSVVCVPRYECHAMYFSLCSIQEMFSRSFSLVRLLPISLKAL